MICNHTKDLIIQLVNGSLYLGVASTKNGNPNRDASFYRDNWQGGVIWLSRVGLVVFTTHQPIMHALVILDITHSSGMIG